MQPFRQESITAGRDCAVLRVTGDVDSYTAPRLREQVIQLVNSGVRHIIADLRGVEFLDSTGLGALVGSLKRLRIHNGSLKIAVNGAPTLKIFQITGLNRVFTLHASVLDAMTADEQWQTAITSEGHDTGDWCREHHLE